MRSNESDSKPISSCAPQVDLVLEVAGGDAPHTVHQAADRPRHRAGDERRAQDPQQHEAGADAHGCQLGLRHGGEKRRLGGAQADDADAFGLAAQRRGHRRPDFDAGAFGVVHFTEHVTLLQRRDFGGQLEALADAPQIAVREHRAVRVEHGREHEVVHIAQAAQRGHESQIVVGLERLAGLHFQIRRLDRQALLQLAQQRVVLLVEERLGEQQQARGHETDEIDDEFDAQAAEQLHRVPRLRCSLAFA
jgi:hypothetical protein